MSARRRSLLDLSALTSLGGGLIAVSAWSAGVPSLRERPGVLAGALLAGLALWGLGALWVWRRRPPLAASLAIVVCAGLAAALVQVPHSPDDLSGDIYRYVWDGRVQAAGINPYRHPPEAEALAPLRDDAIYPGINRKWANTIYPPVAQGLFAGAYRLHADSVAWTKVLFVLLAAAAALVLALLLHRLGRRPDLALLFAWHPLAIWEVGRAGHVDVAMTLLVLLGLLATTARRPLAAGAAIAAAALVKFQGALLLPVAVLGPRRSWRPLAAFAALAAVAYLPFLSVGSGVLGYLPGYLEEEGFESGGRYYPLRRVHGLIAGAGPPGEALTLAYQGLAGVLVLALLAAWWRSPPATPAAAIARGGLLVTLVLLLSTPSYPWYLLMLCALLPLLDRATLIPAALMAGAGELLYMQWALEGTPLWPLDLVWGLPALAMAAVAAGHLARRRLSRPARAPAARPGPGRPARSPSDG